MLKYNIYIYSNGSTRLIYEMASGKNLSEVNEPFRRQGSLRKVLPSPPSGDSQLSMSAKMIDRPTIANRVCHSAYKQYHQEYTLISEYKRLQKLDLPGIYVIPSAYSSLLWFGIIFVRQGIYQGGIFRFKILIPDTFPDGGCPHVIFESNVFHPMINIDNGELDLSSEFQEWQKNVNHIWQLLLYLRRVFVKFETKFPVNEEAFNLYTCNPQEFQERVQQCVKESQSCVYDPPPTDDPHYIIFEEYNDEVHGSVRDTLLKREEEETSSLGLSWVQPGSLQPFSKPDS